jgi:V/A-type H+-transporting ATPase subunit C
VAYSRGTRSAIRYGYHVGRVRVLEGRLLSNATLERLLDAPSFEGQLRVLADTDYGQVLEDARTASEVEAALDDYVEALFDFMDEAGLPEPYCRFFRRRYDYLNLKGRLKADALDVPADELLVGHGSVDRDRFLGAIDGLPDYLRDAAAPLYTDDGGVLREVVDPVVDRAMFTDLLAAADESKSKYLEDSARLMIDLANMKTVVRAKQLGWTPVVAGAALIEGGTIPPKELMIAYLRPLPELVERLGAKAPFRHVAADDLADIDRLDIVADNLLMRQAKKARLTATGPEPIVGYVFARLSEIATLRMLLLGKMAGMSADSLRRRLRDLYV